MGVDTMGVELAEFVYKWISGERGGGGGHPEMNGNRNASDFTGTDRRVNLIWIIKAGGRQWRLETMGNVFLLANSASGWKKKKRRRRRRKWKKGKKGKKKSRKKQKRNDWHSAVGISNGRLTSIKFTKRKNSVKGKGETKLQSGRLGSPLASSSLFICFGAPSI